MLGFVDAAWKERATLGGLLLASDGGAFFEQVCGDKEEWLPARTSNINEAEAQAANVWMSTFGPAIRGGDVLLFIDSKAAEGVVIKGYSSSPSLAAIAGCFWAAAAQFNVKVWIGRVPSRLNPADGFSRQDRSLATKMGWVRVCPLVPNVAEWALLKKAVPSKAQNATQARRRRSNQGQ